MKLHNYQERAVDFVLEKQIAALFIDLGLGKTAIAIEVIRQLGKPAMVLAPLRVCYNTWPQELAKWAPELTWHILHGDGKALFLGNQADVLIMNYEGLPWLSKQSGKFRRRILILDESSMVKSHSTQRFKLLKKLAPFWLPWKMLLSATPAPNGLHELWSQFFLLDRGKRLERTVTAFRKKYCMVTSPPGAKYVSYGVVPHLQQEVYRKIEDITFRLDAKDYLDMPPIRFNNVEVSLSKALLKQYKKLEEEFYLELEEGEVEALNRASLSMKLRQFIQGGCYDTDGDWQVIHDLKLRALEELLATAAGNPILCAIQFKGELAMIRKKFGNVPVIAGGIKPGEANRLIKQWNQGELPLLLVHPAAVGHGLNLQAGGNIVLWYSLTWSLEQYLQLNGRLHRQGQRHTVVINHLVVRGTVDERVAKALKRKEKVQTALLDYLKEVHI